MQSEIITCVGSTLHASASGKFYQKILMMTSHSNRGLPLIRFQYLLPHQYS